MAAAVSSSPNLAQDHLLDQLEAYITQKVAAESSEPIKPWARSPEGHCYGFAVMWAYSVWLSGQPRLPASAETGVRHDANWFEGCLYAISTWNKKSYLDISEHADVFAQILIFTQSPDFFLNAASQFNLEKWFSDSKGRTLKPLEQRTLVFDHKAKASSALLSWLKLLNQTKQIIIVSVDSHAIAIYFDSKDSGMLYDSNNPRGPIYFDSLRDLTADVLEVVKDFDSPGISAKCFHCGPLRRKVPPRHAVTIDCSATLTLCERVENRISGPFPPRVWGYIRRCVTHHAGADKSGPAALELFHYKKIVELFKRQRLDEIEALLDRSKSESDSVDYLRLNARYLYHTHRLDEAIKALEYYLSLDHTTNHPEVWLDFAECLVRSGNYSKALRLTTDAITTFKKPLQQAEFYCLRGQVHFAEEAMEAAIKDFEHALAGGHQPSIVFPPLFKAYEVVEGISPHEVLEHLGAKGITIAFPPLLPSKSAIIWCAKPPGAAAELEAAGGGASTLEVDS